MMISRGRLPLLFVSILIIGIKCTSGLTAFEKTTGLDYRGHTYYTIRNLSLWECQGWCREEPECKAASFSFVLNPIEPHQDTLCLLQNETDASHASSIAQKAASLYYMVKLHIRTDKVCNKPWTFERVPKKMLVGYDNAVLFTSTKEDCLAACLKQERFVCRSVEYNYVILQCRLSEYDRRSAYPAGLVSDNNTDYFENLCLSASDSCQSDHRVFQQPKHIGVPYNIVADYVDLFYYVDKELMANTLLACRRACSIETEFLCRSFLFRGPPTSTSYNCQLYHLDHYTLPDGPSTFLRANRPLYDHNRGPAKYFENICKDEGDAEDDFASHEHLPGEDTTSSITDGLIGPGGQGGSPEISDGRPGTNIFAGPGSGISGTIGIENPGTFDGFGDGSSDNTGFESSGRPGQEHTGTYGSGTNNHLHPGGDSQSNVNCDTAGMCYDVSVHCKDSRIVVQVLTTRPFNGRVYALGRSETCNVNIIDSTEIRLDLTMAGQDCNTQSASGVYTNTVVIQHHSVVMTKSDKIYKVRCTYDMTSKNISFGMMPIRDPTETIPITSAPEAPPPIIKILDTKFKEVETVRIGDRLIFRIEIPEKTPYGIFARSCVAMAKDSRSTFQIIDDEGCPVEPEIFPHFTKEGSALQAVYEAFRFTESYGVIFQCNVKYCLGYCKPAKCQNSPGGKLYYSYGRKKRGLRELSSQSLRGHVQETTKEEASRDLDSEEEEEEMSISQEILVLDLGDKQSSPQYRQTTKLSHHEHYSNNRTFTYDHPEVTLFETCPTRSSVLALAVTCAVLLLIYVLTVFYFVMRKWVRPPVKTIR